MTAPTSSALGLLGTPKHSSGIDVVPQTTQLWTAEQLADRWQVNKSHVYRLARDGVIPTVRIGRYFRFKVDQIEAWEESQ